VTDHDRDDPPAHLNPSGTHRTGLGTSLPVAVMNRGVPPRQREAAPGRRVPRGQEVVLSQVVDDEYDDDWEDEDSETDEIDLDSSSSTPGTDGSTNQRQPAQTATQRNELVLRKRHLKVNRRLINKQHSILQVLGGSGDPFGALPDVPGGNDHLVHHCKLPMLG
jgi:hypothetical protein